MPMEEIKEATRRYGRGALALAILTAFPCILAGYPAIGKGILLGSLFSIANLLLMAVGLPGRALGGRNARILRSLGSLSGRLLVMAAPLYLALTRETYNVFAVAGGLFSVQAAILLDHILVGPILAGRKRRT